MRLSYLFRSDLTWWTRQYNGGAFLPFREVTITKMNIIVLCMPKGIQATLGKNVGGYLFSIAVGTVG